MKKKLLSIMLSFVMVIGVMPVMEARAEVTASGTWGDNITWELDSEGTFTLSGTGAMDDKRSGGEFDRYNVKKLIIGNGITSVVAGAFDAWYNMTEVIIPVSVTSIEICAFWDCPYLSDVFYYGTKEQWNEITIDSTNYQYFDRAIIHYEYKSSTDIAPIEMEVLRNSCYESKDGERFEIGFVTDTPICHTDFKTLKFGFTDGDKTTYMGYSMDKLGLPMITSEDNAEILLGIVLNNIPMKFKDNVTLTLTSEELK